MAGGCTLKWLSEGIDSVGRYQEARRKRGDGARLRCVAVIERLWNGACEGGTEHAAGGCEGIFFV